MCKKEPILVIGGGHQGLAMAAHLSFEGETVRLWNRTPVNIQNILQTRIIECTGIMEQKVTVDAVSCDIDEVLCSRIMVTTPAFAHRDIARLLASKVNENTKIILNPGRTFGALEFAKTLKEEGCKKLPMIAETQTIVYTCRRDENGKVVIYALKDNVDIAALNPEDINEIYKMIPSCIQDRFVMKKSMAETSLGNVGMILHCAPVLMNIGWIESEAAEFKYYYDGISPSIAGFLEKLDLERRKIANALGFEVKSICAWLKETYHVEGENLYECIRNNLNYQCIDAPRTIHHRYIEEDIPYGLVPLEVIAQLLNVETPFTSLIINLASAIREKDYRQERSGLEEELKKHFVSMI